MSHVTFSLYSLHTRYRVFNVTHRQGALWTSNENDGIPQWVVGLRNRKITIIPHILSEYRITEIQRCAIIRATDLAVVCGQWRFSKSKIDFAKQNQFQSLKFVTAPTRPWVVPRVIAQRWISVLRKGSVGLRRFGDFFIPQPTVAFHHFGLKSIGPPVWYAWHESICNVTHLSLVTRTNESQYTYIYHKIHLLSLISHSYIRVTWLMHMCDMTHAHVRHDWHMCT